MMRRPALIAAAACLTLTACQDSTPKFAAMTVELPDNDVPFPDGPGVDAVTANCGACHSADMILNQPKLTREKWQASIEKMRKVFKAPIDPEAEPAILDYLESVSARVK
jgi:cytochrome c5